MPGISINWFLHSQSDTLLLNLTKTLLFPFPFCSFRSVSIFLSLQIIFRTMGEMLQFAVVLVVVLLGFTLSFHVLLRDADTFGQTCLNLFKAMLGEVDLFDELPARYETVSTVLLVVYLIAVTIMLLNLLIAVLSTAHAKVQEHARHEYTVLKARIIQHYRLVVREDLLPPPFSLIQLPFRRHHRVKRGLGYLVFWAVVGPVAVGGGAVLWAASAVVLPCRLPLHGFPFYYRLDNRSATCQRFTLGLRYLAVFIWRAVGCSLHLLAWWLTRPLVYASMLLSDSCGSEPETPDGFKPRHRVRVDEMLKAQPDGVVAAELLEFLVDPLRDEAVREDERKRNTTVEHMKLLRNRLESTIDRKVEALQKSIDDRDVQLHNLRKTVTAMDERLNEKLDKAVELISRVATGGERNSPT